MRNKFEANFQRQSIINSFLKEVANAGGSKSWPKDPQMPSSEFLWDKDVQDIIKNQGFIIETKVRSAHYNDGGQTIWTPETITLMSPEFMAKLLIKNKMKRV